MAQMEQAHTPLSPPQTLGSNLRDSYATYNSAHKFGPAPETPYELPSSPPPRKRRYWIWALGGLLALGIVVIAVIVPVYYKVIRKDSTPSQSNSPSDSPSNSNPSGPDSPSSPAALTTGGDGSEIVFEDGTKYTYSNPFGGYWVSDPKNPFNNNARPNSWTPPLNTSWDYSKDRIQGVNLGGLFVLEPFISPALFQKYPGSADEWTLSTMMAADQAGGGLDQLEEHYKTFITEQDIAEIAGAGLNWIRLPVPWWAIETWPGEPFLAKKSWPYILKVISWCRKYGIRVNLDLHTLPGSQNGYNHSGLLGKVNFLIGSMGVANAQRALSYIRIFTEFFSQPEYKDVVVMFGIVNEALVSSIGVDAIQSFYAEVHRMIREITGFGANNGLYMSIHDGFRGVSDWSGRFAGADRIALDSHPYYSFDGSPNDEPIATGEDPLTAGGTWPERTCERWGSIFNTSRSNFGVTYAGEWSNGFNDCGLFLRGTQYSGHTYSGDCSFWQDSSLWDSSIIAGLKQFNMAQMDAFGDYFFWTWKIGNSDKGHPESPLWSYKLGLEKGWITKDPREAVGQCARRGSPGTQWDGTYLPYATGGVQQLNTQLQVEHPWPPLTIRSVGGVSAGTAASLLHSYVPTGSIVTLPPPEITGAPDGWYNDNDKGGLFVPEQGCSYYDAWDAQSSPVPPTPCGITAPPSVPTVA